MSKFDERVEKANAEIYEELRQENERLKAVLKTVARNATGHIGIGVSIRGRTRPRPLKSEYGGSITPASCVYIATYITVRVLYVQDYYWVARWQEHPKGPG